MDLKLCSGPCTVLTCLLIAFSTFSADAQKKGAALADSFKRVLPTLNSDSDKVKTYIQICNAYQHVDFDSSIHYALQGSILCKTAGTAAQQYKFYHVLGNVELSKGDLAKTRAYYDTSYEMAKKSGDKELIESALIALAGQADYSSDFTKALDYTLQAARIAGEIRDTGMMMICYANSAAIYNGQRNYSRAIEYSSLALDLGRNFGSGAEHLQVVAKAYEGLGISLSHQGKLDKARLYVDSALAIHQRVGNRMGVASMLMQISALQGPDHVAVLKYGLEAQAIFDSIAPNSYYSVMNLGNIGIAYADLVRFPYVSKTELPGVDLKIGNEQLLKTSETFIKRSIALGKQTKNPEIEANMEDSLAIVQSLLGDYKDAFHTLQDRNVLFDSLYSQENKNNLASADEKFQVELRDTQIAAKNQTLAAQERQRWLLIGGLVLLAVIGLLLFRQNRIRKRTNTTLLVLNNRLDEANEIKLRFMSILNHDLRAPVANLINFLHLQKEAPDLLSPGSAEAYSEKTREQAENLLTTMEDLLMWSKGQMKNFTPNRNDVPVQLLFDDIRNIFAAATTVEFDFQATPGFYIHTDEHYLKTIMRNLTSNAVKALAGTPHAKIVWTAWETKGKKYLSLVDNGPGATDQQLKPLYDDSMPVGIKSGLGLHLVRDLARAIACIVTVRSTPEKGTEFQLNF